MSERTLFYLQADNVGVFDGSVHTKALRPSPKVRTIKGTGAIRFTKGAHIEIPQDEQYDQLDEFSIRADIRLTSTDQRQNILEGKSPPTALCVEKGSQLIGSVHTSKGWHSTVFAVSKNTKVYATSNRGGVNLAQDHDLAVTVSDWVVLDLNVQTLHF